MLTYIFHGAVLTTIRCLQLFVLLQVVSNNMLKLYFETYKCLLYVFFSFLVRSI